MAGPVDIWTRLYVRYVLCWCVLLCSYNIGCTSLNDGVKVACRKTFLQVAECAVNHSVNALTLSSGGRDLTRCSSSGEENKHNQSIVTRSSWGPSTFLTATWSDFLDVRYSPDIACNAFRERRTVFPPKLRLLPATHCEWTRPKQQAEAKVFFRVDFTHTYLENPRTVSVPEHRVTGDGVLRRFPARTEEAEVGQYRFLDSSLGSLLVVVVPDSLWASVHKVECRVTVDGYSSMCPTPDLSALSHDHTARDIGFFFGGVGSMAVVITIIAYWRQRSANHCASVDRAQQVEDRNAFLDKSVLDMQDQNDSLRRDGSAVVELH